MELVLYIGILAGATLLLVPGIYLLLRLARGGQEHLDRRFAALFSLAIAAAIVVGVVDTLEGDFV